MKKEKGEAINENHITTHEFSIIGHLLTTMKKITTISDIHL